MRPKLIRITTVPLSLDKLLDGQLHFMKSHYEVIAVSSDKPYLERIGQKEQVKTFHLEMTRKITPLQDLIAVIKLYFFLKKTKPLIVHTHTPKAGIIGMLAAKLAGVPHRLHTVAGLPLLEAVGNKRKLLNFVEKATYSFATKVNPNSFGLLDIIISNDFCPANKLEVLANGSSNGIDTTKFDSANYSPQQSQILKSSLLINNDDFVFIFVGRLVADKGINELMAAFEKLAKTNSKVKLLLVGPYEQDLDPLHENTIHIVENNPAVVAVGYQPDVRPYFAISNALVFPSYREGFPNVVMQAGSMGLPCIVSNINGCNEIIEHAKNGLIIPVKDQAAVFEAMQLLLNNCEKTKEMKQNSRQLIVTRYEQKLVWNAILKQYQTITNLDTKNR